MSQSSSQPVRVDALRYFEDCPVCQWYRRDEIKARRRRDPSGEVDVRVVARRHIRDVHGISTLASVR